MSLALGNTHTSPKKRRGGIRKAFSKGRRRIESHEKIPELSLFSFSSIPGSTAWPRVDVSHSVVLVFTLKIGSLVNLVDRPWFTAAVPEREQSDRINDQKKFDVFRTVQFPACARRLPSWTIIIRERHSQEHCWICC